MTMLISIILVNWNGKKWLEQCLPTLGKQTYKNFEVILVDNGSRDNSIDFVRKNFPKVKIIKSKDNLGFAGGNNLGLKKAKGELILLLNSDTKVPKDYLEKFIKAFDEIPNLASAQSKIRLMFEPNKLDSCGAFWTSTSFLYHFGNGKNQNLPKYNQSFSVFTNKGASMLISKKVIDEIDLFDEDFWNYYEETDFCHRAWLAGYECWYYPQTEIRHAMGVTTFKFTSANIQFHNFKNKLLSFLKNFEKRTLVTVIPMFIILNIGISVVWLLQGRFGNSIALYRAFWWNIVHIPETLKKRSKVQKLRKRSDREIFKIVKKNPRLSYYKYLFGGLAGYED